MGIFLVLINWGIYDSEWLFDGLAEGGLGGLEGGSAVDLRACGVDDYEIGKAWDAETGDCGCGYRACGPAVVEPGGVETQTAAPRERVAVHREVKYAQTLRAFRDGIGAVAEDRLRLSGETSPGLSIAVDALECRYNRVGTARVLVGERQQGNGAAAWIEDSDGIVLIEIGERHHARLGGVPAYAGEACLVALDKACGTALGGNRG